MKIPPKSIYQPNIPEKAVIPDTEPVNREAIERGHAEKEGKVEEGEEEGWPYMVEITFSKLDFDDRKWLLLELVLCEPELLDEVKLGFPLRSFEDQAFKWEKGEDGDCDQARDIDKKEKERGKGKEKEVDESSVERGIDVALAREVDEMGEVSEGEKEDIELAMTALLVDDDEGEKNMVRTESTRPQVIIKKDRSLLPIVIPTSKWLLTYCQIDAIPSGTRDEFLLNLFLMSPLSTAILSRYQSDLESGEELHEAYSKHGNLLFAPIKKRWIRTFRKVNEDKVVIARAALVNEYGSLRQWEELGKDREGVWDVALSGLGGWLLRDIPGPNAAEAGIVRGHLELMAFEIETKALSLVRQITRPDSASDSWAGRYRYKALTITDLVKLSVLVTRSPIPLRRLLENVMAPLSAEIIIMFSELNRVEYDWMRVDEDLAWDIECIQNGLNEVELGYIWDGVMAGWIYE